MDTKTKILCDFEIKRELVKAFNVTPQTVNNALRGDHDSDLAKRIRKRAIDLGGREKGQETFIKL